MNARIVNQGGKRLIGRRSRSMDEEQERGVNKSGSTEGRGEYYWSESYLRMNSRRMAFCSSSGKSE